MDTALRIFILCSFAYAAGYAALWMLFDMRDHVRAWRQRRLVEKLLAEGRAHYDARAQIKGNVIKAGHVYDWSDTPGGPANGRFALCVCWQFDISNGALPWSTDSKGVERVYGYTKAEIIYVAEHAIEFVDA